MATYHPTAIATLSDLQEDGYSLYADCMAEGCHNSAPLDLEVLMRKLGRNHSYLAADLCPKLRCSKCSQKQLLLALVPRDIKARGGWTSASSN